MQLNQGSYQYTGGVDALSIAWTENRIQIVI